MSSASEDELGVSGSSGVEESEYEGSSAGESDYATAESDPVAVATTTTAVTAPLSAADMAETENTDAAAAATGTAAPSSLSGMSNVMARILGKQLPEDAAPILARSSKTLEKIAAAKAADKAESVQRKTKRKRDDEQHRVPHPRDRERETRFMRMATRGVVALFNAVRKSQNEAAEGGGGGGGRARVDKLSKASFLDLLKDKAKRAESSGGAGAVVVGAVGRSTKSGRAAASSGEDGVGWDVLSENYMHGSGRLKDWDSGEEEVAGETEEELETESEEEREEELEIEYD